ncbi:ATP-binding protein [Microvirga sp. CF3016]|uniref:ATP-binding protein n=1 Tax=Microvirga sp. CF3016 TaxID=3110181 RepID=UPI002E7786CA|nr:ATP-binding protein [Microvirga sp. CF3016]MEE1611862.1 ATP-binding protein [Microvirga sp. CF3016]
MNNMSGLRRRLFHKGQILRLPEHLVGPSLATLASSFVGPDAEIPPEVSIDFGKLTFIEPVGVTFISNLCHWLAHQGCKVTFLNTDVRSEALIYLDDSQFFEQHTRKKLSPSSAPRSTTRPLQRVLQSSSHAWLTSNLIPWLASRLSVSEDDLYQLRICLSEIFNNIKDHTAHDVGSIFVQHFPNSNTVSIAVADFGVGIPETVRRIRPELSDNAALVQAAQEGFTSRSTHQNRGAGLDYLMRAVVLANGGFVTIYSRRGAVKFSRGASGLQAEPIPGGGFCPGTTIEVHIRTDAIRSDDE